MKNEFTYKACRRLITELNKLGWTCDYDLSGEPFDLKPITTDENNDLNDAV
jgi:hypothetical protein